MEQARKANAQGVDLEQIKEQLKPRLREYLEIQGARFVDARRFHCIFNPEMHSHGDKNASGSIKDNGFTCFACGAKGDIFKAAYLLEGRPITGKGFVDTCRYLCSLFNIPFPEENSRGIADSMRDELRLSATYVYTNAQGEPLYRVVRFDKYRMGKPKIGKKGKIEKTFVQETYDPKTTSWVKGLDISITRTLYKLPDVRAAITKGEAIYLTEGEKCAELIAKKLGLAATCINGGAKSWVYPHTSSFIPSLAGADLIILADNDTAGQAFAETVAADVSPVAHSVKVINLPGLSAGQDIEEWLLLHPDRPREELEELVQGTKVWAREKQQKDALQSTVFVSRGCYWRRGEGNKEDVCISNFVIHPVRKIIPEDAFIDAVWTVRVDGPDVDPFELDLKMDCFVDRKAFKRTFQHERLSFRGNDLDLQDIKRVFSREAHEEKRGVTYSGMHFTEEGECCFVSKARCIDPTGAAIDDVVLIENNEQLHTGILDASALTGDKAEIQTFVYNLFHFNDLKRAGTIIGWICSCFQSEQLFKSGIKHPHMFIAGEAGSGKSQTVESIIMPIFSLSRKFAAGQLTEFVAATASSSTNTIPLIIDEYKPQFIGLKKVNYISELLRNTYDRSELRRGKADLSLRIYRYKAPVIVVGEAGTIEAAIKERGLELGFDKKTSLQAEHTAAFKALKANPGKLRQLGFSLLMAAMAVTPEIATDGFENFRLAIAQTIHARIPNIPPRIEDSILCCINGLALLEQLLLSLDIDLFKTIKVSRDELYKAVIEAVQVYVMDDQGCTKSAVAQILETMARMATAGIYVEGVDFQWNRDHTRLALDITNMYDRYLKYYRDCSLTHESLDAVSFKRQLAGMSYCIDVNKVATFSQSQKNKRKAVHLEAWSMNGIDITGFGVTDIDTVFDDDEKV